MTTPTALARTFVQPAVTPRRFGLFSVALFPDTGAEDHWEAGAVWQPYKCGEAALAGALCDPPPEAKEYGSGIPLVEADPFVVYGSFECSAMGTYGREAADRAMAHLLSGEQRAVERAIYLGELGQRMAMVDAATVDLTPVAGTGVTVTAGVALLEAYLAAGYHSIGVIHANPREVTYMAGAHLLRTPGAADTTLTTLLGTYVSASGGMSGDVGPTGAAAADDEHWIYATGRPVIRRSQPYTTPPEASASLDRALNNVAVLAERTYVVGWECLTAAVLVQTVEGPA